MHGKLTSYPSLERLIIGTVLLSEVRKTLQMSKKDYNNERHLSANPLLSRVLLHMYVRVQSINKCVHYYINEIKHAGTTRKLAAVWSMG